MFAHLCLQLRSSTASWCRASFVSQRSLCGNASDLSLSLFISSPSFSLWFHDTCHLMPFTQYSLLDQFYFFTSCLSIAHLKFTNKIHQLFTDYLLRLPYSELLETHLFRSRANRRLVYGTLPIKQPGGLLIQGWHYSKSTIDSPQLVESSPNVNQLATMMGLLLWFIGTIIKGPDNPTSQLLPIMNFNGFSGDREGRKDKGGGERSRR